MDYIIISFYNKEHADKFIRNLQKLAVRCERKSTFNVKVYHGTDIDTIIQIYKNSIRWK